MTDLGARVHELTARQWGLVTAAQVERVGLGRQDLDKLARRGALTCSLFEVYATPEAMADPLMSIHAAWIAFSPTEFVSERWRRRLEVVGSHVSAAAIHGLVPHGGSEPEFTVPSVAPKGPSPVRFHVTKLAYSDVVMVGELPITSIDRTIDDLLFDPEPRIAPWQLARFVADALAYDRMSDTDLANLEKRMMGRALWEVRRIHWFLESVDRIAAGETDIEAMPEKTFVQRRTKASGSRPPRPAITPDEARTWAQGTRRRRH